MAGIIYAGLGVVLIVYSALSIALWSQSFRMKWMATGRYQTMLFVRAVIGVMLLIILVLNRFVVMDSNVRGGSPFSFIILVVVIIALISSDIFGARQVDRDIEELLKKNEKKKGDAGDE